MGRLSWTELLHTDFSAYWLQKVLISIKLPLAYLSNTYGEALYYPVAASKVIASTNLLGQLIHRV